VILACCGVLVVSLASWPVPGTVKSFAKNSSGHQHELQVHRLRLKAAMRAALE
jgi:hypothetical protein